MDVEPSAAPVPEESVGGRPVTSSESGNWEYSVALRV